MARLLMARFLIGQPLSYRRLTGWTIPLLGVVWLLQGCKVPISDVGARFLVADTSWFDAEKTLFIFYELEAEQGLGDPSVLEVRYTTDDGAVPWTPLADLPQVHTHVAVNCGPNALCGSGSLHVPLEPRQVAVRLRYHYDGELSLDADTLFNVVGPGPIYSHRSLVVYGVFGESNRAIQWRTRHRFPTIRNEDAQRLGLRREFSIESQWVGDEPEPMASGVPPSPEETTQSPLGTEESNFYLYGADCPSSVGNLDLPRLESEERAIFNAEDLPTTAATASRICGRSTVHTPIGSFSATAMARKNPEVRPAFPVLRSPVKDATPIKYLLSVCERGISAEHLAMQRQRLQLQDVSPLCIDNWENESLADTLVETFSTDILRVRAAGADMVLSIALHHDSPGLRAEVEKALARTLDAEQGKATPRVVGAFVLDSLPHTISDTIVNQTAIWCPAELPIEPERGENIAERLTVGASLACAIIPDDLGLSIGPLSVGVLPIFPARRQYLNFLETYSDAQAGEVVSLSFRAPELPPSADQVPVPPLGVATFFNDESITATSTDAFSFCSTDEYPGFVFRSPLIPELAPISTLPDWHAAMQEENYQLGIVWEFPYLLRLRYQAVAAGAVSAFSASLPFGIESTQGQNLGSDIWLSDSLSLSESLAQCRRFCDHPTFDSAGIYQVAAAFRSTYQRLCYRPRYPARGNSGFPDDP